MRLVQGFVFVTSLDVYSHFERQDARPTSKTSDTSYGDRALVPDLPGRSFVTQSLALLMWAWSSLGMRGADGAAPPALQLLQEAMASRAR